MSGPISGREAELESLRTFVASIADGAAALVLQGEAGVGKTTLWSAGLAEANAQGLRVLEASPAESETTLSFAGIGDLLDPVLDDALRPLATAQRQALARALVLEEEEGPPPSPHGVGVALLNALRALAADHVVLVAVDDVQWLDPASSGALAYAARRLRDERVGLLVARRADFSSPLLDELRRSPPGHRLEEIDVGTLDRDSLHRVLQDHLDVSLPRPLLAEVHEASGGNPFYALEIVRMLRRTGVAVEAGQPLPVPDSLRDLVRERLLTLPQPSRDFLLAAAALSQPTVGLVEEATGVPAAEGLAPAVEGRVVELAGDRIRFTHPLLAAGAYELADRPRRAEMHARLAELSDSPETRAWQLAASVEKPDEDVATSLEEAAHHVRARGAPRPAALLLERAAALTPVGDARSTRRRSLEAADAHHAAGDTDRARGILEPLLRDTPTGQERAAVLVVLARVRSLDNDLRGASELYEQAVGEADRDSLVEGVAEEGVASTLFRLREDLARAVAAAGRAADVASSHGALALAAEALGTKALSEATLARSECSATAERALALQAATAGLPILRQPRFPAAVVRFWHDDLEGARRAFAEMAEQANDLGDESSMPYVRVMLGQISCALGRFHEARAEAADAQAIAEQTGQRTLLGYALGVRAVAEAALGDDVSAVESATRSLELAESTGGVPAWIFGSWALGQLALAHGDCAGALAGLEPLFEHHRRENIDEPGALPFAGDFFEALIESGRLDEARAAIEEYAGAAERLGRRRGIAVALRAQGLLLAATGDLDGATARLEAAVEHSAIGDTPFEHGRALLALGAAQRRAKRRREARETLERALELFERVGAAVWADRVRNELRRISGRAPSSGDLTPAEERVAALVAEGKTNREVAAALYLSDRTVEGHLSRIFGKLGVRKRAQVAGALASRQTQGTPASNTGDVPVSAESPPP